MKIYIFYYIIFLFLISFFIVRANIIIFFLILEILHILLSILFSIMGLYFDDFDPVVFFIFSLTISGITACIAVTYLVLFYRVYGILKLSYLIINKT